MKMPIDFSTCPNNSNKIENQLVQIITDKDGKPEKWDFSKIIGVPLCINGWQATYVRPENMESAYFTVSLDYCPYCKEKMAEISQKIYDEKAKMLESHFGSVNPDMTLLNFQQDTQERKKIMAMVLNYMRKMTRYSKAGHGLFFTGGAGTGKTHIMTALYLKCKRQMMDIIFTNAIVLHKLAKDYVSGYHGEEKEDAVKDIGRLKSCGYLIIDDLGAEQTSDQFLQTLMEIVDCRYTELRPTHITTNLSTREFSERYGDKIASRIIERRLLVPFNCPNWRLKNETD